MSVQRVDLVLVCSQGEERKVLLLSHRGRWELPSALCGQGSQTGRIALALLRQLIGSSSGQKMWLLGFWPPVAAYLACIPGPVQGVAGRWWPGAEAAALVSSEQESWLIRRALAWLADGGAHRRGIA